MPDKFFELAAKALKSKPLRELMLTLAEHDRKWHRLQAKFAKQIAENRARREGKPHLLSSAARSFIKDSDEAAEEAEKGLPDLIKQLPENEILQQSLLKWDLRKDGHVVEFFHPDDQELARKIAVEIRTAHWTVKQVCQARGLKPLLSGNSNGLSLNAAFEQKLPSIGSLGGDAIHLAAACRHWMNWLRGARFRYFQTSSSAIPIDCLAKSQPGSIPSSRCRRLRR